MAVAREPSSPLIVIVGASGFIRRRLVRRLVRDEVRVPALMRHPAAPIDADDAIEALARAPGLAGCT